MMGDRRQSAAWTSCLAVLLALPRPGSAADAREALAAGDSAYVHGDLAGALPHYQQALAAGTTFGALCRITRAESELGEDATGDEQRRLVASSVAHAREAVSLAPDSALGHLWLAATLGRKALKEGPRARLALSRDVKSEIDRAIAIDPGIGRAYHVRALWNRKVASLNAVERLAANAVLGGVPKGASMENAVRDLERAVELEPNYLNHHLELGRTYLQLKRREDARREFERVLALPPTSNPRDPHFQREARELLARLRD
ncbi:MAG TPA: tetratricopeptide repeat protein [Candidatus Eisenbacteria bacterium]|jgi:tetratricopeptide (TPR) repeat protein